MSGTADEVENPYSSPRAVADESLGSDENRPSDAATRIEQLEERVRDLELRINATRLVSPSFASRLFAVLGYWFLGYLLCALISGIVLFVFWFLDAVAGRL